MRRLLGPFLVVLLAAEIATVVAMGVETAPTALGRWLGSGGIARLAPTHLAFDAPIVGDVIDDGARHVLTVHAREALGLATFLAGRGTPPTHRADVLALTDGLRGYAAAAGALSACQRACRTAALTLDTDGAALLRLVAELHRAAEHRRLALP
ncbi:MAG: hypothetical protein ACYDH6_15145 [Acidimicrobiales bacterium]